VNEVKENTDKEHSSFFFLSLSVLRASISCLPSRNVQDNPNQADFE